jgi:predicted ArsR family transcriptional regulator
VIQACRRSRFETRARIFGLLRAASRRTPDVAQALGLSDSATRVHLRSLRRMGLVHFERGTCLYGAARSFSEVVCA